MKKLLSFGLAATCLLTPLISSAADFIRLDSSSYDTMWEKGKQVKKHGTLENPMHYGVEMRHGSIGSNQVVLVTPYTAGMYISSTEDLRLLHVPADFKEIFLANQDLLYVTSAYVPVHHLISWSVETRGSGRTEHLVIEKDGQKIFPTCALYPQLDALMPHSAQAAYVGFKREQILNAPYTVKYVTGEGDLVEFKVTEKDVERFIRDEKNFKA